MSRALRWGLLFFVPFFARAIIHLELRSDPFYSHLFVDARIYHEIARVLVDGSQTMTGPHWQPPFYPQFVSWIYRFSRPDPDAVRWVQMVLGSIGAVWTQELARRLVSPRAGWIAWAIVSLAGPPVLFDLQLLPASLASFLLLGSLVLLLPKAVPEARLVPVPRAAAGGLLAGLAALTVGNLVLLLPWFLGLAVWSRRRGGGGANSHGAPNPRPSRDPSRSSGSWTQVALYPRSAVLAFLLCWSLPLITNTIQNYRASGEIIPISYNGGINFWIGNNPDYEGTVAIRPGRAWQALTAEPIAAGSTGYRAQSDYFVRKSIDWIVHHPGSAAALTLRKARTFFRGDEIPRNQELYPFRSNSRLLIPLLWIRGIAFPTGLVLPLALCGLLLALMGRDLSGIPVDRARRRFLQSLAVFVLFYTASVVAFFVTSRYRLPLYPAFGLFAALAIERLGALARRREMRSLAPLGVVLVGLLLFSNLGLPGMSSEPGSDTQYDLGLAYQVEGDLRKAEELYEKALALNPDNDEAHNNLAGLRLRAGDPRGAQVHLEAVLRRYPDDVNARLNLTRVLLALGDPDGADRVLRPLLSKTPVEDRARRLAGEIARTRAGNPANTGGSKR